jgi:uncharacterized protein YcnI
MRKLLVVLSICFALSLSGAYAHVRVSPTESQAGAEQIYTVRVPTEGKIATSAVVLEIPDGVSVISAQDGAVSTGQGKAMSITWTAQIPPGQSQLFTFEAINPVSGQQIVWKARQRYADGTSRDWVEEPSSKSPASITRLTTN